MSTCCDRTSPGGTQVGKEFYVSPFLPMGGTYLMRTPLPA